MGPDWSEVDSRQRGGPMPGTREKVEFEVIEEGNDSPYDDESDAAQDNGADEDA
jgi:hypothetical protein